MPVFVFIDLYVYNLFLWPAFICRLQYIIFFSYLDGLEKFTCKKYTLGYIQCVCDIFKPYSTKQPTVNMFTVKRCYMLCFIIVL